MAGSDEGLDRSQLLQRLLAQFSDGELRTLCFELGVEYEDLGGRGRADNARELIALMERRADLELDRLRYTVRFCHEVGVFSQNQYRHASGLLAEAGWLVGK